MTATLPPISSVDEFLLTQPRLTCVRWPERDGWWRCRGSGERSIYGVRGPEVAGGLWCMCPGFHRYQYCAHSAAVRSHFSECPYCLALIVSRLERREKGWLMTWECTRPGCRYRWIL